MCLLHPPCFAAPQFGSAAQNPSPGPADSRMPGSGGALSGRRASITCTNARSRGKVLRTGNPRDVLLSES